MLQSKNLFLTYEIWYQGYTKPSIKEMIKDSDKHLFDMVIVWKLDRFSCDRYDSARYKVLLKKNNVRVVSATEVISSGADGILLESVLEGFAEYYSADLAEKVTRGMTENALKCKFNGGTRPVGYVVDKEHHFQIDPLTCLLCWKPLISMRKVQP